MQYAALAMTWGASFLFIKVGLQRLSPPEVVLGRLSAGAVALLAMAAVTRQPLPRRPVIWAHLAVVSVLLCVVPFLLFSWAEKHVASGLASVYNGATPLMTALVALAALPGERPTTAKVTGLLTGFAGVLVVFGPWRGIGSGAGLAQAGCLLATFCYGLAFVYLRRFVTPYRLPAMAVATVQVSLGAALMLLFAPVYITGPVRLNVAVIASISILGVGGTGLAYLWNTNIVAGWGATNASTVTYFTPLVGVVLGAVVLGEAVAWNEPVGALIVITGIALSQGRLRWPQPGHRAATPLAIYKQRSRQRCTAVCTASSSSTARAPDAPAAPRTSSPSVTRTPPARGTKSPP
jgi:drug/metabolite transporter (DMT)-like permease